MADLITAAPGWYVRETDGHTVVMDPVIAWTTSTDEDGDPILLPYVSGGRKTPPILLDAKSFAYWDREVVYQPTYIPEPYEEPEGS
ncbi:hypothetical protein [Streptomyces sp. NPDC002467]|uniref:hypothetical protein n=1 Tax=Streptomyces sp. NPDC002467 TaxID=3364647 RepID=UPI003694D98D